MVNLDGPNTHLADKAHYRNLAKEAEGGVSLTSIHLTNYISWGGGGELGKNG